MHSLVDNFFICGFSGAGKSTLLNELAAHLPGEYKLVDSDHYIKEQFAAAGEALGEYIKRVGFEEFRKNELQVIEAFKQTRVILALGGGALNPATEKTLTSFHGIWLDTPFEICWSRIAADPNRPLVEMGRERIEELYKERLPLYQKHRRVKTSSEAIEFIKSQLKS